jgi:hypothetical protein
LLTPRGFGSAEQFSKLKILNLSVLHLVMKTPKTIDTYYPSYYHSSWLDFEQKHLLGWQISPQEANEYEFEFSYNEWLAQKYCFRSSHLAISQGYGAVGIQWHIGGGCYVITNAQDAQKAEHGIELNSKDCLYLVFAYRHKDLWDGNALMPRMKKFIQHLENMPANPIETIYTRATDVNGHNMRHLRLTGMLPSKNATDVTLDRVYRRYFGATDWKYNDCEGKPFLKFRYNPKYPLN